MKHLHLCSFVAIRRDPEINQYYNRKHKKGKKKMFIIKNVLWLNDKNPM